MRLGGFLFHPFFPPLTPQEGLLNAVKPELEQKNRHRCARRRTEAYRAFKAAYVAVRTSSTALRTRIAGTHWRR